MAWTLGVCLVLPVAAVTAQEDGSTDECRPWTLEDLGPVLNAPDDDPPDEVEGEEGEDDPVDPDDPASETDDAPLEDDDEESGETEEEGEGEGDSEEEEAEEEEEEPPGPVLAPCDYVYPFEFPVVGGGGIGSVFGDVRAGGNRWHAGVDIFAPKLTPVVAVSDGVVTKIADVGIAGDYIRLLHTDGWSSLYIHLNNDRLGTDDGLGFGVRPDLTEGDSVSAGDLLGWIGDSGNAEPTPPHLHFELRLPDGQPIDPEPSLRAAADSMPAALAGDDFPERPVFSGAFLDDEESEAEIVFDLAISIGLPVWCDTTALRTCAEEPISRGQFMEWVMATTISRDAVVARARPLAPDFTLPELDSRRAELASIRACALASGCNDALIHGDAIDLTVGVQPAADRASGVGGPQPLVAPCTAPDASQALTRGAALRFLLERLGYAARADCDDLS